MSGEVSTVSASSLTGWKVLVMSPQAYVGIAAVLILGGAALPLAMGVPIVVGLIIGLFGLVLAVHAVMADSSGNTSAGVPSTSGHTPPEQVDDGQQVVAAEHTVQEPHLAAPILATDAARAPTVAVF